MRRPQARNQQAWGFVMFTFMEGNTDKILKICLKQTFFVFRCNK
jgi:hypothetical protein